MKKDNPRYYEYSPVALKSSTMVTSPTTSSASMMNHMADSMISSTAPSPTITKHQSGWMSMDQIKKRHQQVFHQNPLTKAAYSSSVAVTTATSTV